jgi:hypothetical protein
MLDNKLQVINKRLVRNIDVESVLESFHDMKVDSEEKQCEGARSHWDKLSGNATLPRSLKHFLVDSVPGGVSSHFISIPFKPAIWKEIIENEKSDDELFARKSKTGTTIETETTIVEDVDEHEEIHSPIQLDNSAFTTSTNVIATPTSNAYWNELEFKEFVRTIPWLHSFSSSQVESLASHLETRSFVNNKVVLLQGEPIFFGLIR